MTAGWRCPLLALGLSLAAFGSPQAGSPRPDMNALKKGVVRIRNTRFGDVGTGIIVKVNREEAYIVTAAHVVRGDANPEVYLFTRRRDPLRAKLIHSEEDDRKGLALLWLKADGRVLAGLTALALGSSYRLAGGEPVQLVGFPEGTDSWTVTPGTVARREGREVVFSGPVTTGNSGGPVLSNGSVVGLVTDKGLTFSYAAQSESVALYLRGIEPELADLSASPKPIPTPAKKSAARVPPADEFCRALDAILVASESGFNSMKGEGPYLDKRYRPTIDLPGSLWAWLLPGERAYYILFAGNVGQDVEAEFTRVVSHVDRCLPDWEHKEMVGNYRYHKFRENAKGKVVSVYYNVELPRNGEYELIVSIYPRGNTAW